MIVIGVTGGVGTGKSTVAKMFQRLGAVVLDADAMAHRAMEPKRVVWRRIVKAFGEEVLNGDQTINRRRLAELVFRDAHRRAQLEEIVHPHVARQMRREVHRLRRARRIPAVVLDVPLLVEVGARGWVDALVVVTAPPTIQRRRLARAYGWSAQETDERRAAQLKLSAKAALADDVVDNSDGVDATRTQVKRIWNKLVPPNRRSSTSRP